jgi:hypothetical protein
MRLMQKIANFLILSVLASSLPTKANAEPVVTAISGAPKNESPPNYLKSDGDDEGYVAITARVSLPPGLSCVTPTNLYGYDNFFTKNYLEVVLFATVEGFQGVDPKQPIPIAAYKFDDASGKYCTAPFTLPITLVPNHRFGRKGPTGAPQPKITITMVYTSKGEELITPIVTGWINVAAAVATGGAAQTVIGISNIASNKAVTALTNLYNTRSQNKADQKFTIDLPWATLIKGPASSAISFYEGSTNTWELESVERAIARIRSNPKAANVKSVFDINFSFEYRRSLFLDDNDFDATTKKLKKVDSRLSSASILNFPAKDSIVNVIFPNLTQILGSTAPSIPQAITAGDASKCDVMFVMLRSLGLNSFDRAIVADALLDGESKLRKNTSFVNDCFNTEKGAYAILVETYGNSRYAAAPSLNNPSLIPINGTNVLIDTIMQDRMSEIRSALMVKLGAAEKANVLRSMLGATSSIAWAGDFTNSAAPLDTQISAIAGLNISSANCFYRLAADPGPLNEYRTFMIANLSTSADKADTRYLIVLDFDSAKPYSVRGFQFRSVINDTKAESHVNYLKASSIDDKSSCGKTLT